MTTGTSENALRQRFDAWFRKENPWRLRGSANDRVRKLILLRALQHHRYRKALDIGCGEGDLTCVLAERVDEVTAIDICRVAIERANQIFARKNITYLCSGALEFKSHEKYDFIFCSEMLYYLERHERLLLLDKIVELMEENGVCCVGIVVSDLLSGGSYFSYEEAVGVLEKNFKILSVTTAVPKGLRRKPLFRTLTRLLCALGWDELASRLISVFMNPQFDAYQANCLCVKL